MEKRPSTGKLAGNRRCLRNDGAETGFSLLQGEAEVRTCRWLEDLSLAERNCLWKRALPATDAPLRLMEELQELTGGAGERVSCCQEEGWFRIPQMKGMKKQPLQWGLKVLI